MRIKFIPSEICWIHKLDYNKQPKATRIELFTFFESTIYFLWTIEFYFRIINLEYK